MGYVFARRVYDLATTICAKTFIAYIAVIVTAPDVLAADVFRAGIFRRVRKIAKSDH